jgi:hypothetical protein
MATSKQVPGRKECQEPRTSPDSAAAAIQSNYRSRAVTMSPPGPRPPPKA